MGTLARTVGVVVFVMSVAAVGLLLIAAVALASVKSEEDGEL